MGAQGLGPKHVGVEGGSTANVHAAEQGLSEAPHACMRHAGRQAGMRAADARTHLHRCRPGPAVQAEVAARAASAPWTGGAAQAGAAAEAQRPRPHHRPLAGLACGLHVPGCCCCRPRWAARMRCRLFPNCLLAQRLPEAARATPPAPVPARASVHRQPLHLLWGPPCCL